MPHQFAKDMIEQRLRPVITTVLTEQLGHDVRVAVVVDPSLDGTAPSPGPDGSSPAVGAGGPAAARAGHRPAG